MANMMLNAFHLQKLVDYENHRTETQYEDSLIFKIFLFQVGG